MSVEDAYRYFYIGVLIFLAILVVFVFIRVVKGPLMADRIVGINSTGTLVIVMICVLSLCLEEDYLLDVAILYALISFLAVVVLTKIYAGVYKRRIEQERVQQQAETAAKAEAAAIAATGVQVPSAAALQAPGTSSVLTDTDREAHNG